MPISLFLGKITPIKHRFISDLCNVAGFNDELCRGKRADHDTELPL
jgi:hypothetical protein